MLVKRDYNFQQPIKYTFIPAWHKTIPFGHKKFQQNSSNSPTFNEPKLNE